METFYKQNDVSSDDYQSNATVKEITTDQAMELVGNSNRYQYIIFTFLILQQILISFIFMSPTFFLEDPHFNCGNQINVKEIDACKPGCVISNQHITITSEFNLICSKDYLRMETISFMYLGVALGNLAMGMLADWYGRKFAMCLGWLLGTFSVLGIYLSTSYEVLLTFFILTGFTLWPPLNISYIIVNEQCGEKMRQYCTLFMMISFGIGEAILTPIVYQIQDWRKSVIYFFFIPITIMNLQVFFFQDSPKFWSTRDVDKTFKLFNKIAQINSMDEISQKKYAIQNKEKRQQNYTYLDLFKIKSLRGITLSNLLMAFCLNVIYFGAQFALSSLGINVYLNTVIAGLSQAVILLPSAIIVPKMKRKFWMFMLHLLSVIFCFSYLLIENEIMQTVFAGLIKAANRLALTLFSLYVTEVYPTSVRSLGSGITYSFALCGSILASPLVELSQKIGFNGLFLVGCVSALGLLPYNYFKETLNKGLQEEIEED